VSGTVKLATFVCRHSRNSRNFYLLESNGFSRPVVEWF